MTLASCPNIYVTVVLHYTAVNGRCTLKTVPPQLFKIVCSTGGSSRLGQVIRMQLQGNIMQCIVGYFSPVYQDVVYGCEK